jgi:hypothetical protein
MDTSKANEVQASKSSKESTTQCKAIAFWWMGDEVDDIAEYE